MESPSAIEKYYFSIGHCKKNQFLQYLKRKFNLFYSIVLGSLHKSEVLLSDSLLIFSRNKNFFFIFYYSLIPLFFLLFLIFRKIFVAFTFILTFLFFLIFRKILISLATMFFLKFFSSSERFWYISYASFRSLSLFFREYSVGTFIYMKRILDRFFCRFWKLA